MKAYKIFGSMTSDEVKSLIQAAVHWVDRNVEAKVKDGIIYLNLFDERLTSYFNDRKAVLIRCEYPDGGTIIYQCKTVND